MNKIIRSIGQTSVLTSVTDIGRFVVTCIGSQSLAVVSSNIVLFKIIFRDGVMKSWNTKAAQNFSATLDRIYKLDQVILSNHQQGATCKEKLSCV